MWWQRSAQEGQKPWSEDTVAVRERGWWEEEGSHEFVGNVKTGHKASATEAWLLAFKMQDPRMMRDSGSGMTMCNTSDRIPWLSVLGPSRDILVS